ncbi:uncharacterized protein K452DRAFT_233098 [Aplosporella prunicola CBS 121167]|uniref:NUDE domain-containing protein n=1 Tax=Aplosporella prunicola CBS 121167 TaxID=1176127 RepID=A0A6A6B526_9PEZI|nr:uncharacterized protein K452DRAFT_233098 [Aplosporella prunicola CBS 121167]KAF2139140.1 hypothetical protein K452DRAFT_233098 [Aplosporella prunicola CBS 121167]
MPSAAEPPSSPTAGGSLEEDLAYYKAQYEQLEVELQEFQASSRELEAELERDIEASEKRERGLKEKVEGLGFEVEEWKAKYKQSKTEANGAQNALQREITTLRDQNRTLQLTLRDIEVANDEHERQARYHTSSLEDLEQKYNVTIERGVMLEEEIKAGEQEREDLRIENQRLRDELSDISIETDIIKEKLRLAEDTVTRFRDQKARAFTSGERPRSPVSETSTSATTVSSPTMSTPPPIKEKRTSVPTPPSPPPSEYPEHTKERITPIQRKRSVAVHDNTTPRAVNYPSGARHSRAPSIPWSSSTASGRQTPANRTTRKGLHSNRSSADGLPRSSSLYQIRGLIGKMQKLEARVHSARSKLPGPTTTPPRASPRNNSANGQHPLPIGHTLRKRTSNSTTSSVSNSGQETAPPVSKLSFGTPTNTKSANGTSLGPFIASSTVSGSSRPSSRNSGSDRSAVGRPTSRTSHTSSNITGGRTTPIGHYSTSSTTEARRPRSSVSRAARDPWGDRYGGRATLSVNHNHSQSVSDQRYGRARALSRRELDDDDDDDDEDDRRRRPSRTNRLVTPVKRADFSKSVGAASTGIPKFSPGSGIPAPSGLPAPRGLPVPSSLPRTSIGRRKTVTERDSPSEPPRTRTIGRQRGYSEVGETW